MSGIRLVRLGTVYQPYLESFYALRRLDYKNTYEERKKAFEWDAFGWADFWSHSLGKLGYQALDIHANVQPIQQAWAKENGVRWDEQNWLTQVAAQQILQFKPDVLFLSDYGSFSADWIRELRAACPSLRLVISWCGAPYSSAEVFKASDLILSCVPELVEDFEKKGHRALYFQHGFDPRILDRLKKKEDSVLDFTFIGQIVRAAQFHNQREELLREVVAKTPLKIFSPAHGQSVFDTLKFGAKVGAYGLVRGLNLTGVSRESMAAIPVLGKAAFWKSLPAGPVSRSIRKRIQPAVFGLDMFSTLAGSRVTLNSHIDISPKFASNMRLFEATGVGACLLTDWKENLSEFFEDGREVVSFKSAEECVEKFRWLLAHPKERAEIAKAGQRKTLSRFSFDQRAVDLDLLIRKSL